MVVLSLIGIPLSPSKVAAQDQANLDHFVYLPAVLYQSPPSVPEGITLDGGSTDSRGEIVFADANANAQVEVQVKNQYGQSLPNMHVVFFSNGNQVRALVVDPNVGSSSGYYYPGWGEAEYPTAIRTPDVPILIAIPIILIGGGLGFYHGYKLGEDPPRVDLEVGYTRVCFTYEQFKHTAAIGGIVLAVVTSGGSAFWHFAGEVAVEEVVLEAGGYINEWGEQVPGWPGEWCFRKSWFEQGWWYTPETDMILPSVFSAELRWNRSDTDVDLHVYDSFGNHAYYGDKTGILGGALDRDDQDGFGPETYTQFSDRGASYYEVRVHYYSDHGHGPTTATVKVFNDQGQLIANRSKLLYDEDWWYVYTVDALPGQSTNERQATPPTRPFQDLDAGDDSTEPKK
jgi:hypothetical protein